jgi:hypothetical protein
VLNSNTAAKTADLERELDVSNLIVEVSNLFIVYPSFGGFFRHLMTISSSLLALGSAVAAANEKAEPGKTLPYLL